MSTWLRMGYGVLNGIVRRIMSGVKLGDALPQHWAETDPDAYPQKERGQEWVMRSECHTHHIFWLGNQLRESYVTITTGSVHSPSRWLDSFIYFCIYLSFLGKDATWTRVGR